MAIDDRNVVDAIGVDQDAQRVVLTISDHLNWDEDEHLELLQDKLNCYLSFIESGELLESYPEADGLDVKISLVCKYPPSDEGLKFLVEVASIISEADIVLEHRVL